MLADHQGTIRDVVAGDGAVLLHRTYDAFGNVTEFDSAGQSQAFSQDFPFAYTGRPYDAAKGLYDYRARWYDPAVGRFVSQDPISFAAGDMNVYRYVGNNPMVNVDPSGLCYGGFSSAFELEQTPQARGYYDQMFQFQAAQQAARLQQPAGEYLAQRWSAQPDAPDQGRNVLMPDGSVRFVVDRPDNPLDAGVAKYYGRNAMAVSGPHVAAPPVQPAQNGNPNSYIGNALGMIFVGDYSGAEANAAGVAGSIAFGFTGLDVYKDVADWVYGIQHWETSWSHVGNQVLNTVAFLPLIGVVKNLKHVDELADAGKAVVRNLDEAATVGKVYDVGLANDLRKSRIPNTQVNHLPQSRQAESLIGNFNPANKVGDEPAIRLPISEHEAVNAAQRMRTAPASARDLLADEIRILRNNTNAPNSGLQEVIRLNKQGHDWDYRPLHRTRKP